MKIYNTELIPNDRENEIKALSWLADSKRGGDKAIGFFSKNNFTPVFQRILGRDNVEDIWKKKEVQLSDAENAMIVTARALGRNHYSNVVLFYPPMDWFHKLADQEFFEQVLIVPWLSEELEKLKEMGSEEI